MHVPTLCDWFSSSASTCDSDNLINFHLIVSDGVVSGIGVGVVIRSVELYDLVKTPFWFFWFRWRLCRLRSSGNWVVGVARRSWWTKPITICGNEHCDWFILPLLLPTPAIWFSLDHKRDVSDGVGRKFSDSPYVSDFLFSLRHKRSWLRLRLRIRR